MNLEMVESLTQAICEADRVKAAEILNNFVKHASIESCMHDLLDPSLEKIGALWDSGSNVSLAQAYVASKITEDFLTSHSSDDQNPINHIKGTIILGNAEDDFHSLGRSMVSIFLRSAGWQIIDLGNDVLAEQFVDAAELHHATLIGVSAMMYTTAINIAKVRECIDKRNLSGSIKLLVGGAVFRLRPELMAEVGADGTAHNAIKAPELCSALSQAGAARISL